MFNLFKIEISLDRIYGLDVLRSLSIIFVLLAHGNSGLIPERVQAIISLFIFDGVTIFFVLSGFLVGGILIKSIENFERGTLKFLINFWLRRWFRTLPTYYFILTILLFLEYSTDCSFTVSKVSQFYLFCQNLYYPRPLFFGEAWSLSVEEWFYLLVPLLLIVCINFLKLPKKIAVLILGFSIIILVTTFRYSRYLAILNSNFDINDWDSIFHLQVITRLDSIMYGLLGAYSYYYYKEVWTKYRLTNLVLGCILLLLIKFYLPIHNHIGSLYSTVFSFSLMSFAILLILPYFNSLKYGKGILYKLLTYISIISYSMYLTHYSLVKYWIIFNIPWGKIVYYNFNFVRYTLQYSCYWVFTIALSILLYKYFEVPTTKLRNHKKLNSLLMKLG